MPDRTSNFIQLANDAGRSVTGTCKNWTSFLTTASRLYKYPYHEQLMIYAQRPDATACATYDLWNNTMRRYVRRGARSIALLDTSGETVPPPKRWPYPSANARRWICHSWHSCLERPMNSLSVI